MCGPFAWSRAFLPRGAAKLTGQVSASAWETHAEFSTALSLLQTSPLELPAVVNHGNFLISQVFCGDKSIIIPSSSGKAIPGAMELP